MRLVHVGEDCILYIRSLEQTKHTDRATRTLRVLIMPVTAPVLGLGIRPELYHIAYTAE